MQRFEPGKVYKEYRTVFAKNDTIHRYRCVRRTDKSVWVAYIKDDGTECEPRRHRINYYGDCEYLYGSGVGNARSVWYSSSLNLFAKDVEE